MRIEFKQVLKEVKLNPNLEITRITELENEKLHDKDLSIASDLIYFLLQFYSQTQTQTTKFSLYNLINTVLNNITFNRNITNENQESPLEFYCRISDTIDPIIVKSLINAGIDPRAKFNNTTLEDHLFTECQEEEIGLEVSEAVSKINVLLADIDKVIIKKDGRMLVQLLNDNNLYYKDLTAIAKRHDVKTLLLSFITSLPNKIDRMYYINEALTANTQLHCIFSEKELLALQTNEADLEYKAYLDSFNQSIKNKNGAQLFNLLKTQNLQSKDLTAIAKRPGAKEIVLAYIAAIPDTSERLNIINEALTTNTPLHSFFAVQRGWFGTRLGHGSFAKLAKEKNTIRTQELQHVQAMAQQGAHQFMQAVPVFENGVHVGNTYFPVPSYGDASQRMQENPYPVTYYGQTSLSMFGGNNNNQGPAYQYPTSYYQ